MTHDRSGAPARGVLARGGGSGRRVVAQSDRLQLGGRRRRSNARAQRESRRRLAPRNDSGRVSDPDTALRGARGRAGGRAGIAWTARGSSHLPGSRDRPGDYLAAAAILLAAGSKVTEDMVHAASPEVAAVLRDKKAQSA